MLELQTSALPLILGAILAAILAIISYRMRALTVSGMFGAFVVGTFVFGFGGWLYAIPLLFFFITSSLLSKIKNDIKLNSMDFLVKAAPRDIYQVFANGGMAILVMCWQLFTDRQELYFLYLASIAVASADTWGTELGTLLSSRPFSIVSFRRVMPGESGGVSLPGTLAALIGAFATVFLVYPLIPEFHEIIYWFGAAIAGFAGALLDSVLGATIQASHRCSVCGVITEKSHHCNKPAKLIKGVRPIDNDAVNFLSNFIAVVLLAWLIL